MVQKRNKVDKQARSFEKPETGVSALALQRPPEAWEEVKN